VRQHERLGAAVRAGGEQFRGAATVGPGGFNTRDRRTKPPTAWNKKWIEPRNAGLYHTHTPHWSSGRSSRGLIITHPRLYKIAHSVRFLQSGSRREHAVLAAGGAPVARARCLCAVREHKALDPTSARDLRPAPHHGAVFLVITAPRLSAHPRSVAGLTAVRFSIR